MELYKDLLAQIFRETQIQITFPELTFDLNQLLESKCYQTLEAIRVVLDDTSLDDRACSEKIETIVRIFEHFGSDGGSRHDFG